ncbi:hypothetical protein [Sphingobacterium hungaricum]|uniref:Immunity protein 26 n=1 Tax=Sphingobacterium hungaricum TaxID=2082723 RepID=A0A928UTA7_9SPHI|nr:hypothetical protein [Sphingobacterium hungaricum]MBE8712825.1 hypothetical protein [Sphingobacterium hungaricum]
MNKITDINQGDLLAFKANDEKYRVLLCTSTIKEKSPQSFAFAALTYNDREKPTAEKILSCEFWGIGNSNNDYFKYSEIELNQMWNIHPETKPYFLGSYGFVIWRKDFMKFRHNFEVIGDLKIVENLDKNGNGGMNVSDWNLIKDFFTDKINSVLTGRGQKTFRLKAIIKNEQ